MPRYKLRTLLILLAFTLTHAIACNRELGPNSAVGTMQVKGKTYRLQHAVAAKVKYSINNEPLIVVIASDQPFDLERLRYRLRAKGDEGGMWANQPFADARFALSGKVKECGVWTPNWSFGWGRNFPLAGQINVTGSQVSGKVKSSYDGDGRSDPRINFIFNTELLDY